MKSLLVENDSVSSWIEDGILYQVYHKNVIDMDVAKDGIAAKLEVCKGKDYPAFIDVHNLKNATKEAREYLSGKKGIENIAAAAILAPTLISKLIGTFFITFNNPGVRIKLFTDQNEAIEWLKTIIPKST